MNEFSNIDRARAGNDEYEGFLILAFGIADPKKQALVMKLFNFSTLRNAYEEGTLTRWDPVEAARQELIACGLTEPDEQRPVLARFYQEIEDPRWS